MIKIKYLLFLFLSLAAVGLAAQNTSVVPCSIHWTGIDVWKTEKQNKNVIAFAGAAYDEDYLPYYTHSFPAEKNAEYNVTLSSPVFLPLETSEEKLVEGKYFPEQLQITTYITTERGVPSLYVKVFPFVQKEGKMLKISTFSLAVEKKATIQKTAKAPAENVYATTSVLAKGKFVKIKISESGIYKLTYENLTSMGIDPANVRVFGYGGAMLEESFLKPIIDDLPEVAVYMNKGSDGIFNAGDYILFYTQGVNSWQYDTGKRMFTHTLNTYSTEGYYFITSDAGTGRKIENDSPITVPADAEIVNVTEFVDYQVYEKELFNFVKSGRTFYGEQFSDNNLSRNFPFSFPNLVKESPVKVRVDVAAGTSETSSTFTVKVNEETGQNLWLPSTKGDSKYMWASTANNIFTFRPSTDNLTVNLTYNKTSAATGYLNYIEVNARRQLTMTGSAMFFRNVDNLGTSMYNNFQISGANANVQIWDVTDAVNIKRVSTTVNGGLIEFNSSNTDGVKQYLAIDPTASGAFSTPTTVGVVSNQNLHGLEFADMIIITHPRFLSQANRLAEAHRTVDNMRVNVLTTNDIYNEFSSGTPDATAYRKAVKMFYDKAMKSGNTQDAPKYLLLFGRGTYDNRRIIPNLSSENLVLTYQSVNSTHLINSYVTDDYFGMLDDKKVQNIISDKMDIAVGRFTVLTEQQATDVVNKTINYMQNTKKGIWKNQLCFVGDDGGGDNEGKMHAEQADNIAQLISQSDVNKGFQLNKIYLDSYKQEKSASGDSYPQAKAKLSSLIRSGLLMLNYTGHAGSLGWADEHILMTTDIKQLYNEKLPLWVAAACDFLVIDDNEISAGEHVFLNPVGGGIGIVAAARTVYSSNNFSLNRAFTGNLFPADGIYPRLGEALRLAKNQQGSDMNKLSYVLVGDPALKLAYPTQFTVTTDKINQRAVSGNDTIKALSVNTIEGTVKDASGSVVTDYNGTLEINIYDKNQRITTLNNHNESNGVLVFDDRPNILYSGKANVKNGVFTFTFMTPKDIRYNYGGGRINYYASEPASNREAQGYYEKIIVGGTSSNYDKTDTTGPELGLYLNHVGFKSGDKVNETPMFFANISDKNGINTAGNGIGHDLRLVIDGNVHTSYTVNEYFQAEPDSYTAGSVQYKIPALPAGKHTLTFYAWDLLNNSATATLDFEVAVGLTPDIFNVSCYPNPASENTRFIVTHDRPETVLETTIEVYDLVGRKIWSKTQNTTENLTWNLEDATGKKVSKGVYIYRVSIKTSNSNITSKANKIIVSSLQ